MVRPLPWSRHRKGSKKWFDSITPHLPVTDTRMEFGSIYVVNTSRKVDGFYTHNIYGADAQGKLTHLIAEGCDSLEMQDRRPFNETHGGIVMDSHISGVTSFFIRHGSFVVMHAGPTTDIWAVAESMKNELLY